MFGAIDIRYLTETLTRQGNVFGVNGFMLPFIGEWWTGEAELSRHENNLRRLAEVGARCGLDSNFIKVALGYRTLPKWDDDQGWTQAADNIGAIAALARRTGVKGLAIDTENYDTKLWITQPLRFKEANRGEWRRDVKKRGAQVMRAITDAYPMAEILLLQEGAYWWYQRRDKSYEMWIDFFDGLASVHPAAGLILATESTYSLSNSAEIGARAVEIRKTMSDHVEDKDYWDKYVSVAIGMWPVGKAYDDKSVRYSVASFREQFASATNESRRYTWIYGHGSAWWQMTREQSERYARETYWVWEPHLQRIPTVPDLDQYRQVFAPAKVSACVAAE